MLRKMESNTGLISYISGKQTYSYLHYCNVHVQQQQSFFSVKFFSHHRPNVKSNCSSLNTLRAVPGNSFEAEGCLKSRSIIPNFFFPDSQPANTQYKLFFLVDWTHTGIHGRVLLTCSAVLWKLQFEGLLEEHLNLSIVWLQLTSLRSP